ncbi:hypothetical protein J6590_040668 [Homalodisca vitripennis]|nr:hypothetical protein J6590_040668 [Homalodisca vitripennis]
MDNSESGDELAGTFLTTEAGYMVQTDDLDDEAVLTAENTDDSNHDGEHKIGNPLREQDRFLPIANVAKIMKKAIPENGKIAKDARECVQECVSEFISFITSEASDRCHTEKRKTINGEDILYAMTTLGFDNYVEPLKMYLQKYRENSERLPLCLMMVNNRDITIPLPNIEHLSKWDSGMTHRAGAVSFFQDKLSDICAAM